MVASHICLMGNLAVACRNAMRAGVEGRSCAREAKVGVKVLTKWAVGLRVGLPAVEGVRVTQRL